MRLLLAAALAAIALPAAAGDVSWLLPPPGLFCPVGQDVPPILIDSRGGMGIDLMDCARVRLEGGRVQSEACYGNGGASVPYDTDLIVRPDGALLHDGVLFRRRGGPAPCPAG